MKALDHGVTIYYLAVSIASVCGELHAFPQRHFVRKKIRKNNWRTFCPRREDILFTFE